MSRRAYQRLAPGIYQGERSIVVKVQIGSGPRALQRECSFALDTPLDEIVQWRDDTRRGLRASVALTGRSPFEVEIEKYLARVSGSARAASGRRAHLRPWVDALGQKRRNQIRTRHIEDAIAEWIAAGFARKTILNRFWALHHLLVTLAGNKRAWTPLANVNLAQLLERGKTRTG